MQESPASPEERIFQSIIIQAVKDYITVPEEKKNVKKWVKRKLGTFKLCAVSMGIGMGELQSLMLNKMDEIDRKHETVFKYSRAA